MANSLSHCSAKHRCLRGAVTSAALLTCLFASAGTAVAGVVIGGESGAYLRAPVGADAAAMGGAATAAPTALEAWWNPAMLAVNKPRRLAAGMGVKSLGRMEGYAGAGFRIPPRAGIGLAFLYRGDPFLDELRDANEELLGNGGYTTLTFKAGLGYVINRRMALGASIGFYHQRLSTLIDGSDRIGSSSVTGIGGFSIALHYRISEHVSTALVLRKLGLSMDWEIQTGDFDLSTTSTDKVLPEIVLATQVDGVFLQRPLIWKFDLVNYLFDGTGGTLDHPEASVNTGWEWELHKLFAVRAGIGELPLSGTIVSNRRYYFDTFSLRICAGFAGDLQKVRPGMKVHYAVMTDKVWAGVDQSLEITYDF